MQTQTGWLWIVLLFPAHQAEESDYPSKVGQTKYLQETQDEFVNTTRRQNDSFPSWSTYNITEASNGDQDIITTLPYTTVKSKTEYQGRLLKPAITIHSVNGACNVTLNCTVTGGDREHVTYAWSNSETRMVLSDEPSLHITQKPPDGAWDYTCTVRNKESENSSTISLRDHCLDPSPLDQEASASLYAKYLVPFLLVLVVLLILFLMYRRKRGRGSHSRTVSINESSDSDFPTAEEAAQLNPEAFKPIPEEPLEMAQAPTASDDEEASSTQGHQPDVQAKGGLL